MMKLYLPFGVFFISSLGAFAHGCMAKWRWIYFATICVPLDEPI